ncbi:neuropathy target esterase sws isoform X1 [Condylostylus longicornis]|uniref:neuropathy target esterase sws isoform X1 n=1 Tax=Condylostylus longicornis TaxID=2530218 RepID=UPI00244DDDA5|nr:neuropathy target esterase sws isoform X1 [Condylostylus longicornis]
MDFLNIIKLKYKDYGSLVSESWIQDLTHKLEASVMLSITIGILIILSFIGLFLYRRYCLRARELIEQTLDRNEIRLRFRKRDKMIFYGRRMLRKVKNVSGQVYGGQGRKRAAIKGFARKILHLKRDDPMQIKTVEPPPEYLEETAEGSDRVPPDALCLLQGIRIFGHFEKPIFIELCKSTEIINLQTAEFLFKVSDQDDSVFIVQSGAIDVYISNLDGSVTLLKTVRKGEAITSLLSFIDVLSENTSFFKSVAGRAVQPSKVIRLPMRAFQEVFNTHPDIMIRIIQVVMMRLQRVTFTALRNYLGLHSELVQNYMRVKQVPSTGAPTSSSKLSPGHRRKHSEVYMEHSLSTDTIQPDMIQDLTASHDAARCALAFISSENADAKLVYKCAVDGFLNQLGLTEEDRPLLEGNVEVEELQPGVTLIDEGTIDNVCLWYVLSGSLSVLQWSEELSKSNNKKTNGREVFIHNVHPGEIIGALAILTGEASSYTIRAKHHTRVALMRRAAVYNVMGERPNIILDLASTVVRRLSPLVRQCDFAIDWIFLESGRAVYRQDETPDSTYIVLCGRMRSVTTHSSGKKEIVGEYGKGDLVGIVEMITETSRTTTVMAVRDSELAKLPVGLFNAIKVRYPAVASRLMSLLSHRMLGMQTRFGGPLDANHVTHRFSTVALVPVNDDVPLTAFTYELYHSLCAIGPTLRLTSETVRNSLGPMFLEPSNDYRLTSWLAQQEDRNIITLYQCDSSLTAWTQRCMRQADVIIIVGLADRSPTVGKFEREIDRLALRTQKELVLLYHEALSDRPVGTIHWLNMRPWVTHHHHIQCPKRMFTRKSQYRINDLYSRVLMSEPNMHSDFSRLARWLSGNSIGLVLGGGGARGAAHVGMLKAIQEAGIPIDMVGGVSIGAFMGALWCSERSITTVTQKAREWCKKMTQWFRQLLDLTYPITSMFSGREFNKTIRDTFGDVYIEDLWIPYFTLTTDISASCHRIHTNGSLWRYVRASMSLSGYMPPLCDPKDGHHLLDGGYVNNLPADVMKTMGAAHIIAIDVGSADDTDLTNYGDDLSGWWVLYKKWNPFTSPVKVPNLPDIQSRLAYVSCVRQLEEVKRSDYCEYVRPPIDKYKTLAFSSFNEIRDVGYVHGKNLFEAMSKDGRLARFNKWFIKEPPRKDPFSLFEYTFVDLAQVVYKVNETETNQIMSHMYSEDEDLDGYISEPSFHMSGVLRSKKDMRIKRAGGSLSLSENEMDSDGDVELSLPLKLDSSTRSRSLTHTPRTDSPITPDDNNRLKQLGILEFQAELHYQYHQNETLPKTDTISDGIEDLPLDSEEVSSSMKSYTNNNK